MASISHLSLITTAAVVALTASALPATALEHSSATSSPAISAATADVTPGVLTEGEASDVAARTGRDQTVTALTTETSETIAHPGGTFTLTTNPRPVRVKTGQGWQKVDNTLTRRSDGSVSPAATPLDMRFSGGGDAPLVTMTKNGKVLKIRWVGQTLPTPQLSGDTATYPEVLPGVDLVMRADIDAFSQVLVVKTREAGRDPRVRKLAFDLDSTSLTPVDAGQGATELRDSSGKAVFTSTAPMMWDSAGPGTTKGGRPDHSQPGPGARSTKMESARHGDRLEVTPSTKVLDAAATVYPVHIDPPWSGGRLAWTYVDASYPTTSYYNSSADARVGYESQDGTTKRSFFKMDINGVRGKVIKTATFRMVETWAWSCTARPVQVWATNSIATTTTWSKQPTWSYKQDEKNVAYAWHLSGQASPCPNPSGGIPFNVQPQVKAIAGANGSNIVIGVRAASETDTYAWKKFANNPTLAIDYDTLPTVPTGLTPCSGTFGLTDITLSAVPADADGGQVKAQFKVWKSTATEPTNPTHTVLSNSGARADLKLGRPAAGIWKWRVRSANSTSADALPASAYSAVCTFTVDTTAPVANVTVSSNEFTDYGVTQQPGAQAGRIATFTITPQDASVTKVAVGLDEATPRLVPVTNGVATIRLVPTHKGPSTLKVQTFDAADNTQGTDDHFSIWATAPDTVADPKDHDVNSDGGPDIVRILGTDGRTCLYLGSGASTFIGGSGCEFPTPSFLSAADKPILVGDWDDDNTNDVMDLCGTKLCLYRGNGAGGFTAAPAVTLDDLDPNDLSPITATVAYTEIYAVGDWDGDGDPDLAAKDAAGALWLVTNDNGNIVTREGEDHTFGTQLGTGWGPYAVVSPGDVNGDGQTDLFGRLNTTGVLYLYTGRGRNCSPYPQGTDCTFGLVSKIQAGTNWNIYNQIFPAGDWDGDGHGDFNGVEPAGALYNYDTLGNTAIPFVTSRVSIGAGWTSSNWML